MEYIVHKFVVQEEIMWWETRGIRLLDDFILVIHDRSVNLVLKKQACGKISLFVRVLAEN